MTNRTYIRPYSAGITVKRPRIKRYDLSLDGPPPPTPEGINNGVRPHGGYRGTKPLPPGQFSFDKDSSYQQEIEAEYNILVSNENYELHGAPYWLGGVQREITNSGESPLFTNKLLPTGKFEQEHGEISFERALLHTSGAKRRMTSAPRRRHLNGRTEFYRPNSTHQYLSATDLRSMQDSEENMIRYGRPTRTTLLRARQRTNSAPVNAYDLRRENLRRSEDVRNNSIFNTSKEYFNIYANDGETMHSFLTGARYNRAHLIDSKGLTVYGVYMPRENPTDCFIAGPRRLTKDHGEDIPSAPPDSPRSDGGDTATPPVLSRPTSSKVTLSRPSSSARPSSYTPGTKQPNSRPQSLRKSQARVKRRPRSGQDQSPSSAGVRSLPPKPDSPRKELPLPGEVTLEMPDHINKGKSGVYITLKGHKMIETVDSKLPRVTGVSLPKIRKSPRDAMDEFVYANQPPPTPVDGSVAGQEKPKLEPSTTDGGVRSIHNIDENAAGEAREEKATRDTADATAEDNRAQESKPTGQTTQESINDVKSDKKETQDRQENDAAEEEQNVGEIVVVENKLSERKSMEIGPTTKKVNFSDLKDEKGPDGKIDEDLKPEIEAVAAENKVETENATSVNEGKEEKKETPDDNVVFFVTEQENEKTDELDGGVVSDSTKDTSEKPEQASEANKEHETKSDDANSNGENGIDGDVENVIKVEISEGEKKPSADEPHEALTSEDYPFENRK